MVVSRSESISEKVKKIDNDKVALLKRDQVEQTKLACGLCSNIDMLLKLKGVALNPCISKQTLGSIQKLRNQILKVRKSLMLSKYSQRKRKHGQYLNGSKSTAASGLTREKSDNQNPLELRASKSSKFSCSQYSNTETTVSFTQPIPPNSQSSGSKLIVEDSCLAKRVYPVIAISDNFDTTNCSLYCEDCSYSDESVESIKGSTSMITHEDLINKYFEGENISEFLEALRSLDFEDVDNSAQNSSHFSSSKKQEDIKLKKSLELLLTSGNHPPRPVIPIGPKFQAEIPKWGNLAKKGKFADGCSGDSELDSKWLGTRIWPSIQKNMKNTLTKAQKAIGKGRPDSCLCASPGSSKCHKDHIAEARLRLQSEMGTSAFLSWKFDEMGEVVSKSWTLKEQKKFESLVKMNPLSSGTNFWKLALREFPSKSMKGIVNYYYSVFIPRRMSLETRTLPIDDIDSDGDQAEDDTT
ncbi:At-rich interactive domain-containing protein 2 [Quillaja saponaria]|uniref:At-rich interactive domain-containing protein 2 n=1 Tax=Quillaja saponaria TaxID=32244 RepID=A0AAD7LNS8_QUISA|nr:At-rich interactive domain-containing protein 2 [Quillaja saponaria]